MRFIKLTQMVDGGPGKVDFGPCFVNLDRAAYVYRDGSDVTTIIQFSEREREEGEGMWINVRERPEEFLPLEERRQ